MKNKLDLGFYLIPILLVLNLFIRLNTIQSSSPDTYAYIDLAKKFPNIDNSLFPIFYPLCLKIVNFICNDYFISYKIICGISLLFSLFFVKFKNFYWREIWTLFTSISLMKIICFGWSEIIVIPLLLLIFYYNHQFLNNKISSKKNLTYSSLLLIICVLTKYSSLFFIGAFIAFSVILLLIKDKKAKTYIRISSIASVGSIFYLLINFVLTGHPMGERIPPDGVDYNIRLSLSHILFTLNPLFSGKQINYLGLSWDWEIAYLVSFLFFIFFVTVIIKYFNKDISISKNITGIRISIKGGESKILIINIIISTTFLFGTIYSYFITKIDILDFRLLLGYYLPFFFAVIVALPNRKNKNLILLLLGLYCAIVNIYIVI